MIKSNLRGILCLILAVIFIASLAGCSSTNTSIENNNSFLEVNENVGTEQTPEIDDVSSLDSNSQSNVEIVDASDKNDDSVTIANEILENSDVDVLNSISVKFINVGQGDSAVIVTSNNDVILIDASDYSDAQAVIDGLSEYEFEDIDLFILTHPHADHIRGAKTILETYDVNEVLMCSYVATSKLFTTLLETLDDKDIKTTQAYLGQTYDIDGVHIQVVGVDSNSKDNNNSSVVTKVTYGDISIMFTGDAEEEAEKVIIGNGFDLSAQILKAGHHGSNTSSSEKFLDAVNPKIAIISCGIDNKYGHPHEETINKFINRGIQYYRTDELGSIKLEIDGVNIVSSFEDTMTTNNSFSARTFFFEPNVAEVKLVNEQTVVLNMD